MFVVLLAILVVVGLGIRWLARRARHDLVPGRRPMWVGLLAAIGVAALVAVFFVARDAYWGLRPTPTFESLADQPARSLSGTVAFLQGSENRSCVRLVAAAGQPNKKVACFRSQLSTLRWLSPTQLEVTSYGDAQHRGDRWRVIIDVTSGARRTVPKSEVPATEPPPADSTGPNGERVTSESKRGTLQVSLADQSGRRVVVR